MTRRKAALLTLAIIVPIAIASYYAWDAGLIAGKGRERLSVLFVLRNGPDELILGLRNTGEIALTVDKLYIERPDGTLLRCYDGYVFYMHPEPPEKLQPNETVIFEIMWEEGHGLEVGDEVTVRILTARGNTFEAEVSVT